MEYAQKPEYHGIWEINTVGSKIWLVTLKNMKN